MGTGLCSGGKEELPGTKVVHVEGPVKQLPPERRGKPPLLPSRPSVTVDVTSNLRVKREPLKEPGLLGDGRSRRWTRNTVLRQEAGRFTWNNSDVPKRCRAGSQGLLLAELERIYTSK